ncbi:MAG TPA: response regulator transcription factor [Actinomycetota bacterium]|jgi:DNA-binding NarL/FixJ family response regulator
MPTTIVVVDDHAVVREGLTAVLSDEPDFRVVGEAAGAAEALHVVERVRPRVVVVDDRLPSTSGRELCATLTARYPSIRIVLAMTFLDRWSVQAARAAGAAGLILKDSEPTTIREAVRAVAAGRSFLDPRVRRGTDNRTAPRAARPFGLTGRELDVVALLPRGMTNAAIAAELGVSRDTVKTHVRSILAKLRARDRTEAAAIAMREGLA